MSSQGVAAKRAQSVGFIVGFLRFAALLASSADQKPHSLTGADET